MVPVDVSNTNPEGRIGRIEKVMGVVPPLIVMGVKGETELSL